MAHDDDPRIIVLMTPIPGRISGNPQGKPLVNTVVTKDGLVLLDLKSIEAGLAKAAKRVNASPLTIVPRETRLARLATQAGDLNKHTVRYLTGFRVSTSRQPITLIYVDRPCAIRESTDELQFDVVLKHPGLHWLVLDGLPTDQPMRAHVVDFVPDVVYSLTELGP